ncbi:TolB family protein [Chitinophaga qingshengii]|uniref:PD40 domain-containing protein n=1 Tax=Chitinophaga qingshengii TaxID=1569794 RepID=A0ABR7TTL0_9BACT|nr:PD40 domain-containing protein [Chitinophaga qingshengii]MBC9932952.1 PD40 domain-containing protein [Chitinophaga qingshengii]
MKTTILSLIRLCVLVSLMACSKDKNGGAAGGKAQGTLYYASFTGFMKLDLRGGQQQRLIDIGSMSHQERFDVSRDGSEIVAYEESLSSDQVTFKLYNTSGQVTGSFQVRQYVNGIPRFSPDKSKIAVIWQPASTYPRKFMAVFTRNGQQVAGFEDVSDYAWLPDGRMILTAPGGFYLSNQQLSSASRLAAVNQFPDVPGQLDVSPDGAAVLFTSNYHIWAMNMDGSGIRQLTSSDVKEWYPSWSADGKQVFFTLDWSGNCKEVRVMDVPGQTVTIDPHSDAVAPRVLVDGNRICSAGRPMVR